MRSSKNIVTIGKVKYHCTQLRVYLPSPFRALLGTKDIVFNLKKLMIKRPTLDSKKTISIRSNGDFTITMESNLLENFIGQYNIIEEDEDTFILKRIKDE